MKQLLHIIKDVKTIQIIGNSDVQVAALTIDSRKAGKDALFFAQKGTLTDGHKYIESVIAAGATVVVCESIPENIAEQVCYVQVEDVVAITGIVAAAFFDYPSEGVKVIGVTGTNGKTTVATILYKLF